MMTSRSVRRLVGGVSLAALQALGACSSGGRGTYLAGNLSAGSTPPEATSPDGGTGTGTGGGGTGGGGGGGGTSTGGGGGGGGQPSGLVALTSGVDDLAGGVLHTAGNAVLVTPPALAGAPAAGGVVAPLVRTAGETVRDTGSTLASGGLGAAVNGAVGVNLDGRTVAGGSGETPVAVATLSPGAANGSLVGASVLSGGQTAAVSLGQPTAGATSVATNGAANGLLGGQVLGGAVGDASAPLVGLNLASQGQTAGSLVTVGAVSGGQPLAVAVGDAGGALTGALGGVATPAAGAGVTASGSGALGLTGLLGR